MIKPKEGEVTTRLRQVAVPLTPEEEAQLKALKKQGRQIGYFVREAILEKFARERRAQLAEASR